MRDLQKASTKKPNDIWGSQWTICWLILVLDSSHNTWTSVPCCYWRHPPATLQKHEPSYSISRQNNLNEQLFLLKMNRSLVHGRFFLILCVIFQPSVHKDMSLSINHLWLPLPDTPPLSALLQTKFTAWKTDNASVAYFFSPAFSCVCNK